MSLSDRFIASLAGGDDEPGDERDDAILTSGNERYKLLVDASRQTEGPHVVLAYHSGGVHIWNNVTDNDPADLPTLEAMIGALGYYVATLYAEESEERAYAFVGRLASAALGP